MEHIFNEQYLKLLYESLILINGKVIREKFNKLMPVKPSSRYQI